MPLISLISIPTCSKRRLIAALLLLIVLLSTPLHTLARNQLFESVPINTRTDILVRHYIDNLLLRHPSLRQNGAPWLFKPVFTLADIGNTGAKQPATKTNSPLITVSPDFNAPQARQPIPVPPVNPADSTVIRIK